MIRRLVSLRSHQLIVPGSGLLVPSELHRSFQSTYTTTIYKHNNKQVCDPYEQGGKPLTYAELSDILPALCLSSHWSFNDTHTRLHGTYSFQLYHYTVDYKYLIQFIQLFHNIAINTAHLPYTYTVQPTRGTISVELYTVPLKGLSYNDLSYAMQCDSLYHTIRQNQQNDIDRMTKQ